MGTHRFMDVHVTTDQMRLDLSMNRFEKQFNKAQYDLDSAVMTGMVPFMPMVTGTFINITRSMSASLAGTGWVYAAAPPYGRFLYFGKTMVGANGSTYAHFGEKKVLVSEFSGKTRAKENLQFNKTFHPNVQAEWFEAAKTRYGKQWEKIAKRKAGGGVK